MKKKLCSLFVLFVVVTSSLSSQSSRLKAWHQIDELKNGVLLVRLQTSQKKIDYLKSKGQFDEADAVEKAQKSENESLIRGFKEHFDFCDVYFFNATNALDVRKGKHASLFKSDGGIVPNLDSIPIYYAAIKNAAVDSEFHTTRGRALTIMDNQFQDLNQPFPFYTKLSIEYLLNQLQFNETSRRRSYDHDVKLVNYNLNEYHRRTVKKRRKKRYKKYFG